MKIGFLEGEEQQSNLVIGSISTETMYWDKIFNSCKLYELSHSWARLSRCGFSPEYINKLENIIKKEIDKEAV